MFRNLIKIGVLGVVATCSWQTASYYMNEIVLEVQKRQPSITDVIIKQQVQESLKEAETKIEKVVQEENVVIKQEEVAIKPATPPEEKIVEKPKEEEVVDVKETETETETEEIVATEEEIETETEKENVATGDDLLAVTALTKEESAYLINYLIDHYFLFGETYYTIETDPIRYERKKLANDMEAYIIDSIGELQSLTTRFLTLKSSDMKPILEETMTIAEKFKIDYKDVGEKGPEFQAIYEACNKYFESYIVGLNQAVSTFETIETTTNKALVLPLMMKSINQDILPAIRDILNQGFSVKEKTNKIYIEGIDGSFLLTPEEVMAIIENPRSILPQREETEGEGEAKLDSELKSEGEPRSDKEKILDLLANPDNTGAEQGDEVWAAPSKPNTSGTPITVMP